MQGDKCHQVAVQQVGSMLSGRLGASLWRGLPGRRPQLLLRRVWFLLTEIWFLFTGRWFPIWRQQKPFLPDWFMFLLNWFPFTRQWFLLLPDWFLSRSERFLNSVAHLPCWLACCHLPRACLATGGSWGGQRGTRGPCRRPGDGVSARKPCQPARAQASLPPSLLNPPTKALPCTPSTTLTPSCCWPP